MNIRLKLVLSAAALAAGCVLLAGCSGSASSASSAASSAASSGAASQSASEPAASVSAEENGASDAVASAVDALLEADPISNQFEITAMNIEYDFGLKADDVTSYKGLKSNDNGDAGLVLAIQPAAGKAQDVMDTLKTYQQDQVAFYGNYAEFAQAQSNVENAIIDGGYDPIYGARPLKRYIQSHVETMIAKEIIGGAHTAGDTLTVDADGNGQLMLR